MLASLGVGASLASENPFAGKLTQAAAQGFSDNNPITLASGVLSAINPVTFAINGKILDSTVSWLTSEDYSARSYLYNSFGFGKWLGFF
jgi:hypothetical protein